MPAPSSEATDDVLSGLASAAAERVAVNGVSLHVVSAGDPADPLVVLLHGFPEFWYAWRDYVEPIVDAGYRVAVPDQRGYNRSDKPDDVSAYRLQALSRDVRALIASEDRESAHVVGHDWGAFVAWDLALRHAGAVDRLGVVNVPHPTAFSRALRSNPGQLARSWYAFYFQLPWLPEWASARNDFALWVRAMRDNANPGTFSDEDFDRYRAAWSCDGAPTAMLNWYRAVGRYPPDYADPTIRQPTIVVWGEHDQALVPELAADSVGFCENARLETFADATHWIHHEHSDRVTKLLLDHFE